MYAVGGHATLLALSLFLKHPQAPQDGGWGIRDSRDGRVILAGAGQSLFLEGNVSKMLVGLFSTNLDFLKYCIHAPLILIFRTVVSILKNQAWHVHPTALHHPGPGYPFISGYPHHQSSVGVYNASATTCGGTPL